MKVDRHVELFRALIDRPELPEVEKFAVRHPVQHRALEAEFGDRALEFVGGRLRIHCRKGRKGCEAPGVGRAYLGEAVVHLASQIGGNIGPKLLGGGCAMRKHLDVNPGLIHLLETQASQIIEPFVGLIAPASLRTGEMLGQFRVPVMLLNRNDRTIRLFHHDVSPQH